GQHCLTLAQTPTTARLRAHPIAATRCGCPSPKSRVSCAVKGTWTSNRRPSRATVHAVRGCTSSSTTWVWTTYLLLLAAPTQGMSVTLVTSQPVPLKAKRAARNTPRMVVKTLSSISQSCSISVASSKV
ncbi:hypothetical protein AS28_08031, partial [Pygoscelis adeliae]